MQVLEGLGQTGELQLKTLKFVFPSSYLYTFSNFKSDMTAVDGICCNAYHPGSLEGP